MLHLRPHHTKTACREIGAQRTEGSQAHRSGWWWDGPWGGVANWDARICPKGSRDKRLHPGLPLVCEGSMLMGFRNGNPSKSGDTLNLLANIEAIGDWRRLVEMSLPEIQDSGHGASISGGQWGSGTGHRAGWQHGTANVGVVCVCACLWPVGSGALVSIGSVGQQRRSPGTDGCSAASCAIGPSPVRGFEILLAVWYMR